MSFTKPLKRLKNAIFRMFAVVPHVLKRMSSTHSKKVDDKEIQKRAAKILWQRSCEACNVDPKGKIGYGARMAVNMEMSRRLHNYELQEIIDGLQYEHDSAE